MNTESKSPTIKPKMKSTFHPDGTVSFWNVYTQRWERVPAASIGEEVLASLSDAERARIKTMAREVEVLRGRELQGEAHREAELILRAQQVRRHLQLPPVPFVQEAEDVIPHAAIFGTPREKDYRGCGPITMYVTSAGEMAAYHYGYTMPEGWTVPEGLTPRRGTASCGEACWW